MDRFKWGALQIGYTRIDLSSKLFTPCATIAAPLFMPLALEIIIYSKLWGVLNLLIF